METLRKFRTYLGSKKLAGAFISNPLNVRYLTGYGGGYPPEVLVGYFFNPEGFLFVSKRRVTLFVDSRYEGGARKVKGVKVHVFKEKHRAREIVSVIASEIGKRGTIGVEERFLTFEDGKSFTKALVKNKIKSQDISASLIEQRSVKSKSELKLLRDAIKVTDQAFSHVCKKVRVGMTESQVANEIASFIRGKGMELSFSIIVASGPNSAVPHHHTGDRKIRKGEFLLMDFGARNKGYHADMTRTVFVGKPSKLQLEVYNLVRLANETAAKCAKPGMMGGDIDKIARETLGKYDKHFTHSLGHGVGLVIHEDPKLSKGSKQKLSPNQIFSIEPGVYIPKFGGVRIEDLALMTPRGAQVLSKSTKNVVLVG